MYFIIKMRLILTLHISWNNNFVQYLKIDGIYDLDVKMLSLSYNEEALIFLRNASGILKNTLYFFNNIFF